jgi:hypothetical protein
MKGLKGHKGLKRQTLFHTMHLRNLFVFFVLSVPSLRAAVVYSGTVNIPIAQNFTGLYLNPLSGTTSGSHPGDWNTAPWLNPFFGGVYVGNDDLLRPVVTGADQIENLATGTMINGSSNMVAAESGSTTHIGAAANQFQLNTPGLIGFVMQPTTGGTLHYGWLLVTFHNSTSGMIHSYAYESTAGTGIAAGITGVPEPGRGVLVLAGLMLVMVRRRR